MKMKMMKVFTEYELDKHFRVPLEILYNGSYNSDSYLSYYIPDEEEFLELEPQVKAIVKYFLDNGAEYDERILIET